MSGEKDVCLGDSGGEKEDVLLYWQVTQASEIIALAGFGNVRPFPS